MLQKQSLKSIYKICAIFFLVDSVLFLYFIFIDWRWALNSQVAFLNVFLIVMSSFFSYKKILFKNIDKKNLVKKEDNSSYKVDNLTPKEILKTQKDALKQDRGYLKKGIYYKVLFKGFFYIFRIISYIILVVCFFCLLRKNLFSPIPYLIGVSIIPISTLIYGFFKKP